jgi:alkyl hydroperoxide reductase subunit AhpF
MSIGDADADADAEIIRQWNTGLGKTVPIILRMTEDQRSTDFERYVAGLTELAPNVRAVTERLNADDPPAILAGNLFCYHALPEGLELTPFLNILSVVGVTVHPDLNQSLLMKLERVRWPAELRIYVTSQCSFCPQAVRQFSPFPLVNPLVRVTVIDGLLFPEMAKRDGVRSVPTVILDERFRWSGELNMNDVVDAVVHRDPDRLSARTLEDFVKEGNAALLAEMMLREDRIFPTFLDLLIHSEWSVRLGAMVVVEEIADSNVNLAKIILNPLWKLMENAEDSVKGDALYLFGLLGSEE